MDSTSLFQPVYGTEAKILSRPIRNGCLYFASDTGKIFLDGDNQRKQVGGSGSGSGSANILWGEANEDLGTIKEDPNDITETNTMYLFNVFAVENSTIPDVDALIINSDGRFFRVLNNTVDADGFFSVELIAVSGSGGGGGGPVAVSDLALSVDGDTINTGMTLIQGQDYNIRVIGTSTIDSIVKINFSFTGPEGYTWNRSFNSRSGEEFLLNLNFLPEIDNLTLKITLSSDNTTMSRLPSRNFSGIKVIPLTIRKSNSLNTASIQTSSVSVPFYVNGDTSVEVSSHVFIDGTEIDNLSQTFRPSSTERTVLIPVQRHGVRIIEISVSTQLSNGVVIYTDKIKYEIAWMENDNNEPVIWLQDYPDTVIRYENFVVNYQVYDPSSSGNGRDDYFSVNIYKGTTLIQEVSKKYVGGTWLTLDLTENYEVGNNSYTIACGTQTKDISFFVTTEGSRDLELVKKDSLLMNFSALGRSNNEISYNRSIWESIIGDDLTKKYTASFENFNWYNNGWLNDNDGNGSYLSITNGASISIPLLDYSMTPASQFSFNQASDYTLEFRFRVRNIQEYSTLVSTIPYYYVLDDQGNQSAQGVNINIIKEQGLTIATDKDGNWIMDEKNSEKITKNNEGVCLKIINSSSNNFYGLCIGTQEALFRTPEGVINVRYKEDAVINLSVVVSTSEKLASIYLNGILSGSIKLGAGQFSIGSQISINSNYSDIDIYKIRFYKAGLSMPEVIHNYISDMHDLTLYDQNQLTKDGQPTLLSYHKLVNYNKQMLENNDINALTMPYAVIEVIDNKIGMTDPHGAILSTDDDKLPWKKGNNRYCKITFVNPTLDALYDAGEINDSEYKKKSPSYVCIGADINVQGTSSQGYPRRNYKTKMKSATGKKDSRKVTHDDWGWFYTGGPYKQDWQKWITGKDENDVKLSEEDRLAARDRCAFTKWYQDNEGVGTNKYTWKIDYMESSGTYNTGFANLVGNNIYNSHPLAYYNVDSENLKGLRTSVYGFPVLTFHKHSKPADDAKIGTTEEDQIYEYIGRYNINQDKGSDELFGFSLKNVTQPYVTWQKTIHNEETGLDEIVDYNPSIAEVAECWEMTDNQGTWTSFSYPSSAQQSHFSTYTEESYDKQGNLLENPRLEVIRHYECRYHKDADYIEVIASDENPYDLVTVTEKINDPTVKEDEKEIWRSIDTIAKMNQYIINKWSNWESFVTWCDSTDRNKADPTRDIEPVQYALDTEIIENGTTVEKIGDVYFTTFTKDTVNYRLQKFKQEFDKHLNLEYCLVYYVLTELLLCYDSRGKNMMMASYGPTANSDGNYVWFPIFYDIDTQLGLNNIGATLWDYDCDATLEKAFSTASSVLWVNFADCFDDLIQNKYRDLRANNKLTYESIDGAYLCNPNVFNSYAMRGIRPTIAIGLDEYYKYIAPSKTGYYDTTGTLRMDDNTYAYAINGDRMLSRELLLRNRLNYLDSYWMAGAYSPAGIAQGGIRMRSNANNKDSSDKYLDSNSYSELPSNAWSGEVLAPYPVPYYDATPNFSVTPFLNQYVFTYNDKQPNGSPVKYQGIAVETECSDSVTEGYKKSPTSSEQIVIVPASDYVSSLGDLSIKYLSQLTIIGGKRLLDLNVGSDAPDYFNGLLGKQDGQISLNASKYIIDANNQQQLNPDRKTLLKTINLTNVTQIKYAIDVSGSDKLQEFRALGTILPYAAFADGAPLDTIHLPKTVTQIELIEPRNLNRILTSRPVVFNQDRDTYTGLYIEGVTDYVEGETTDVSSILLNKINIIGGNLGYDSYILLDKMLKVRDAENPAESEKVVRGRINLEDVDWSPYKQVESGTPYDSTTRYYKLTEHSTFVSYNFTSNSVWNEDTLNEKIFTYDSTESAKAEVIDSLEMLDKFIYQYEERYKKSTIPGDVSWYTNTQSDIGYPNLTGSLYVSNANGTPVSEVDITQKYNVYWPKLKIYAANVEESYVIRYLQKTETNRDSEIDVKRYAKGQNVHPEMTSKVITKPNYNHVGWTLDGNHSIFTSEEEFNTYRNNGAILTNQQVEQLTFDDAGHDIYNVYAVFLINSYTITFKNTESGNELTHYTAIYNSNLYNPSILPSRDESSLEDNMRYKFLGWVDNENYTLPTSASTARTIDLTRVKCQGDKTYYACYIQEDATKNASDLSYFTFSQTGTDGGYIVYPKNGISLSGKISLPTTYNNVPITEIDGFMGQNITHFFWIGEDKLKVIGGSTTSNTGCFNNAVKLKYFQFPTTLTRISPQAFRGCASLIITSDTFMSLNNLEYIGPDAFNGAIDGTSVNFTALRLPGSITSLGARCFAYITPGSYNVIENLQIGSEDNPSKATSIGINAFSLNNGISYRRIVIYINNNSLSTETWESYIQPGSGSTRIAWNPALENTNYSIVPVS